MSEFNKHFMYIFSLKNGKKKLAYGSTPEEALEILSFRLAPDEMAQIIRDDYIKISQRNLRHYVHLLG